MSPVKCWDLQRCSLELQVVLVCSEIILGREGKALGMKAGMFPENKGSKSSKFFEVMWIAEANFSLSLSEVNLWE